MFRNYNDPQYKQWRKKVFIRDNYKCQWPHCNLKSKLNAHHIKRWSEFPGLRFITDNGITLCAYHHKMIKNQEDLYAEIFLKIVASKNGKR